MKNLKKILSLVLALAMALSLMTVAFAKDTGDFADGDDVTYIEAVDVMATIGVFNGVGDGTNFDPTGKLTREQAAKIITYMIMGQAQADQLVATIAPFADVSADRWSAGAIAYCASEGIMNGTGNGKFNPTGELTGLQFAKMLLVAVGYDAEIEKMSGTAWGLATSKLAYQVGLNKGLGDINLTQVLTREQAAQMAFTAEKTPMVYYPSKGSTISVNGAVVEFGAQQAQYVVSEKSDGSQSENNISTDVLAGSGAAMIEFGERYCPDLVKENTSNDLCQPVRKWTYKNKTIGRYTVAEDKMVVVSAKDKTLEDVVYGKSFMNYSSSNLALRYDSTGGNTPDSISVYVNGLQASDNSNVAVALRGVTLNKGDVVYAYENSAGKVNRIVVARYSLAKIDNVATNMSSTEKENGAEYRIKLVDLDGDSIGNTNYYDDYNDDTKLLTGFASATYKKDTILAVALKSDDDAIVDSYVAEIVTGKPTAAKETGDGHITVDGTKYQFVTDAGNTVLVDGVYQNFDFDNEYNVYTTKEGYVIGIEGTEATKIDDIYYVTSVYTDVVGGEGRFFAQRVALIDGKVDTVQIEKGSAQILQDNATVSTPTDQIGTGGTAWAGLYTFNDRKYDSAALGTGSSAKQSSGNDILTMIPFSKTAITATAAQNLYGSAYAEEDFAVNGNTGKLSAGSTLAAKVEKADTKMTVGGTTYYMNADTQYLAIESVGSAIDVTLATGGMNVGDTSAQTLVLTTADDTKTVVAFVIAGGSLTGISAASKEVIYVPANTSERYGNDNYRNDLWFMKDGNKVEGAVITSKENQGFYTYSEKGGAYKLESGAENIKTQADGGNYTYKDEAGYGEDLVITTAYDKKNVSYAEIDSTASANTSYTLTFGAVKLNGTVVTDLRSNSVMKNDVHNTAINSVSDLKDATKVATVTADVYFDEGVTFIAVKSITAKPTSYAYNAEEVNTIEKVNALLAAGDNVEITGGTWAPTGSAALLVDAANLTVSGGGITLTDQGITVDNDKTLTVAGAVTTGSGNIAVDGTLTGATTVTTTGTVDVDGTLTASGALTSGNITLTAGTMTVGSIDTSAGNGTIDVTAGVLTSNGTIATGSGNITLAATATKLAATGNITTTGDITVSGGQLDATGKDIAADNVTTAASTTLKAQDITASTGVDFSGTVTATGDVAGTFTVKSAAAVTAKTVSWAAAPTQTTFTGSVTLTDTAKITMPAEAVTLTGTWTFAAPVDTQASTNALAVNGKAIFNGDLSVKGANMLALGATGEVEINAGLDRLSYIADGTAATAKVTFGGNATVTDVSGSKFDKTNPATAAVDAESQLKGKTFAWDTIGSKWLPENS